MKPQTALLADTAEMTDFFQRKLHMITMCRSGTSSIEGTGNVNKSPLGKTEGWN